MDETIFTTSLSAGTRIYHFDMKRDKKGVPYMVITEEPTERSPRVHKHRIFVYSENIAYFLAYLAIAADAVPDVSACVIRIPKR